MDGINDMLHGLTRAVSGLWPTPADQPGLLNGKLRPCPGTPNCICSEISNEAERVPPLAIQGDPGTAWGLLQDVIAAMGGSIESRSEDYIWATFMMPLVGFVDDVEFRLDSSHGVIQVRSASRLGYSDLGVNKARVEDIRRRMAEKYGQSEAR